MEKRILIKENNKRFRQLKKNKFQPHTKNDHKLYLIHYSFGFIYGIKQNKSLGYFVEGKYNKYWNRELYDFKLGLNYVIF